MSNGWIEDIYLSSVFSSLFFSFLFRMTIINEEEQGQLVEKQNLVSRHFSQQLTDIYE